MVVGGWYPGSGASPWLGGGWWGMLSVPLPPSPQRLLLLCVLQFHREKNPKPQNKPKPNNPSPNSY